MANHKSSIKRARQTIVRTERNRAEKSRMKTLRKKTLTAVAAGDKEAATKASAEFSSAVDKAAKRSVIHANKAANLKSKTAKALAGIKLEKHLPDATMSRGIAFNCWRRLKIDHLEGFVPIEF
jgi:small subunit ribosomal protein S20